MSRDRQPLVYGSIDEFLAADVAEQTFIIDELLADGGTGITFANRNHGKTALSLTLGRSVVRGEPFLEKFAVQQGKVAFLLVDKPLAATQQRFRKFRDSIDNGEDLFVAATNRPVDMVKIARDMKQSRQPGSYARWIGKIRDFRPDLVIIDTLRKAHNERENESESVRRILEARFDLFPESAVIFNHHTVKETFFTKERKDEALARGSTAWLDDTELGMFIQKTLQNGSQQFDVAFPRLSYREAVEPVTCGFEPEYTTLTPEQPDDRRGAKDWAKRFLAAHPNATKQQLVDHLAQSPEIENAREDGAFDRGYARHVAGDLMDEGGSF